jgi:hypothetical protein
LSSVLTKRNRVWFDVPASGGASLAGPERLSYPPRPLGPGVARQRRIRLALLARWRGAELDRQLAAGARPSPGTLLAVRGERITSRRHRERVADGLARVLRDAQAATHGFSAAAQPDRGEVLAARTVIAALRRRLCAPEPVTPRGVILLRGLLTDGNGPLYRPSEPGALGSRLRAAAAALEPSGL